MSRQRERKSVTETQSPMAITQEPGQRWSLDIVSNMLAPGRRSWVLSVFDDVNREPLAVVVGASISGARVILELDRLIAAHGAPAMIVSDHGREFKSKTVRDWIKRTGVDWHYLVPGLPQRHALTERIRRRFRDESIGKKGFASPT